MKKTIKPDFCVFLGVGMKLTDVGIATSKKGWVCSYKAVPMKMKSMKTHALTHESFITLQI